jgi:hypothetical protein
MIKHMKRPACLCFILFSLSSLATAQNQTPRVLVLEKEAIAVGSPVQIAANAISNYAINPKGRQVLIVREAKKLIPYTEGTQSPGEKTLLVWDSLKEETKVLWRGQQPSESLTELQWFSNGLQAITVHQGMTAKNMPFTELLLCTPAIGKTQIIPLPTDSETMYISLFTHPSESYALVQMIHGKEMQLSRLDANGRFSGTTITVPEKTYIANTWSKDGKSLAGMQYDGEIPKRFWINASTGERIERQPITPEKPSEPRLQLTKRMVKTKENTELPAVYLQTDKEHQTLVIADAEPVSILPDESAVLYFSQGTLFAVPLHHLDKETYLESRKKALQKSVVLMARQLDSALQQYFMDERIKSLAAGTDLMPLLVGDDKYIRGSFLGDQIKSVTFLGMDSADKSDSKPLFRFETNIGSMTWHNDGKFTWK